MKTSLFISTFAFGVVVACHLSDFVTGAAALEPSQFIEINYSAHHLFAKVPRLFESA